MFSSCVALAVLLVAYARAAAVFNCQIEVPPNPLTAAGLATPYKMTGCDQTQFATQGSFVEAAILDTTTGAIQIYNPLVINKNAAVQGVDFIAPVVPTLPANNVVGIWFGSNAATVTLTGSIAGCVNGIAGSIFGQFAYCNGQQFFAAAATAVSAGLITIPPPGSSTKAATTQTCPTLRDFRVVDMDQSDNVDTTYLLIDGKKLAQNTDANAAANKNSTVLSNGSDNALVNAFISPAMGCSGFTAPSITSPGGTSGGLALNELRGNAFPAASGPALVPLNDDFVVINNNGAVTQSLAKTNLYRAGVGQPQAADTANASGTTYCQQYAQSGIFIALNQALFTGQTSPTPGVANNLFTFMANRFATSFGPVPSLGCSTIFGVDIAKVVQQTLNKAGVVTAATIDTATLQKILNGQIKPVVSGAASASTAAATAKAKAGATSAANSASTAAATANAKAGTAKAKAGAASAANSASTPAATAKAGAASAANSAITSAASAATSKTAKAKGGASVSASQVAAAANSVATSVAASKTKAGQGAVSASATQVASAVSSVAASVATSKAAKAKGTQSASAKANVVSASASSVASRAGTAAPTGKAAKVANTAFNSTLKARNIWV